MNKSVKYFLLAFLFSWLSYRSNAQDTSAGFADLVPFVTTPWEVIEAMLDMAKITKDDYIIDLGSGDGRIPISAAKKFGAKGLGIEIDKDLVSDAFDLAKKEGVDHLVDFKQGDLFELDFSKATVLTLYLFPDINLKLRPKIWGMPSGTRVISHRFDMGDWEPTETRTIELADGKRHTVFLWIVN
ncbi:methyltransferase domain-containing protein [Cecembia rubra]|uniref:methyltransferase domain-containing protein n=1 Tax=Cecembia rubra TaxID=1485585 RepID=UPI0027148E34|nr:methyltransferase domain-containing protein [Cecembia rubra]